MSGTRVPRVISRFNSYICDGDDFLQTIINPGPPPVTNWERLGLSADDADYWHTKRQEWGVLYPKYSNKAFRTKAIGQDVDMFMDSFITFASDLLDKKITVSPNVNAEDAQTFNFVLVRKHPTHPTTRIPDNCYALVKVMGGGMVRISCRTQEDAKRASMAKGANVIQVAYKLGGTPPANAKDGTQIVTLGKADSIQALGEENVGQKVYAFFRWANTKYPELSGPYSNPVVFVIA